MYNVYLSVKGEASLIKLKIDGTDLVGSITSFITTLAVRAKRKLMDMSPILEDSDINIIRIESA